MLKRNFDNNTGLKVILSQAIPYPIVTTSRSCPSELKKCCAHWEARSESVCARKSHQTSSPLKGANMTADDTPLDEKTRPLTTKLK